MLVALFGKEDTVFGNCTYKMRGLAIPSCFAVGYSDIPQIMSVSNQFFPMINVKLNWYIIVLLHTTCDVSTRDNVRENALYINSIHSQNYFFERFIMELGMTKQSTQNYNSINLKTLLIWKLFDSFKTLAGLILVRINLSPHYLGKQKFILFGIKFE